MVVPFSFYIDLLILRSCSDLVMLPVSFAAAHLLCSVPRMLWSINGWYWANAVSYLSPRSSSPTAGIFLRQAFCLAYRVLLLFELKSYLRSGLAGYCRGQGLLQTQRGRCRIRLIQWLVNDQTLE